MVLATAVLTTQCRKQECCECKRTDGYKHHPAPIREWFNQFVSIQFMRPNARDDVRHFDGGASILHMGLTLWGRWQLRLHLAVPAATPQPAPTWDREGPPLIQQS